MTEQQLKTLKFTEQYTKVEAPVPVNHEQCLVVRDTVVNLPTDFGNFVLYTYRNTLTGETTLAIVKGAVAQKVDVPMRLHSSCVTGDILGSQRCDCRHQLIKALEYIEKNGTGLVIYAFQEGRGIGLVNKLRAYYLQERGFDTVEANLALGFPEDMRQYGFVAAIIDDLQIKSIKLLTNNPDKVSQLQGYGVSVAGIIRHEIKPCKSNKFYLETKKAKMGHKLNLV